MRITSRISIPLALALLLASAAPAWPAPPSQGDDRWAPWLGCWSPLRPDATDGGRVCIVADGPTVVRVVTLDAERVVSEEVVTADGATHAVTEGECRGTDVSEWSRLQPMLYRRADLACGEQGTRVSRGVWFISEDRTWIEVAARSAAATRGVRIRRFRPAADQALPDAVGGSLPSAPVFLAAVDAAAISWDVDTVIEASAKLPVEAVQGALTELGHAYRLNAKALARMSDAGVNSTVIDLMVALTYPDRFEVRRASAGGSGLPTWPGFDSRAFDPEWMLFVPGAYGVATAFPRPCRGLSPEECRNMWDAAYDPYYGYSGGWIPLDGDYAGDSGGGGIVEPGPPVKPAGDAKVVKGLGYTQVYARSGSDAPHSGSASGSGGSSAASSSSSSGSSSSGSSASPSGYSSGGGGGDRTAQPRGPGG